MSDRLVQLQEWASHYPTWIVAGVVGFVIVVIGILVWKALRIAIMALIAAVVVAGAWFAWESISGREHSLSSPAELGPEGRGNRTTSP